MDPARTSFQETCTIKNMTYAWLGLNTLTYHGTLPTLKKSDKDLIEYLTAQYRLNMPAP